MPEKAIWMTTSSGPGVRRLNLKGARWPLPSLAAHPSVLPVPSVDVPFFCSAAAHLGEAQVACVQARSCSAAALHYVRCPKVCSTHPTRIEHSQQYAGVIRNDACIDDETGTDCNSHVTIRQKYTGAYRAAITFMANASAVLPTSSWYFAAAVLLHILCERLQQVCTASSS